MDKLFSTDNITTAQIVAIVGAIIGVAVAAGLPITANLEHSIITLVTVLAPVLLLADAHIRNGRARGNADRTSKE